MTSATLLLTLALVAGPSIESVKEQTRQILADDSYGVGNVFESVITPYDTVSPTGLGNAALYIFPLFFLMFIVVGLIFLGVATPTESAALGALYRRDGTRALTSRASAVPSPARPATGSS